MLGRHVYRVSPIAGGGWQVMKDGERSSRGSRANREEATRFAVELASADLPGRLLVEDGQGAILEERLFGEDSASALERAAEGLSRPERK